MTTAVVYTESPAAAPVSRYLAEAIKLVPGVEALLEKGDQTAALSALRAEHAVLTDDVTKLKNLIKTVEAKRNDAASDGQPTSKFVDELKELQMELDYALVHPPKEAVVIGHAIFALEMFEV